MVARARALRSLRPHRVLLQQLAHARSRSQRQELLKDADHKSIVAIVELIANMLRNKFDLTSRDRAKLRPHAKNLRALAAIRHVSQARRFLIQHGGFAPAALVPILGQLAIGVLSHILAPNAAHKSNGAGSGKHL